MDLRIYISHWSGGDTRPGGNEMQRFMLNQFIAIMHDWNPGVHIIYMCDDRSKGMVDPENRNLIEFRETLSKYDHISPDLWPLVKVKAIAAIDELGPILHLDYDIIFKYPLKMLFGYLEKNGIDMLYQSPEPVARWHFYRNIFKTFPKFCEVFSQNKPKSAFNAGVCYLSPKARKHIKAAVNKYEKKLQNFADGIGFEQMIVPHELLNKGMKHAFLSDLSGMPIYKSQRYTSVYDYLDIVAMAGFMPWLGYYHFLGGIKGKGMAEIKQIYADVLVEKEEWDLATLW